MEYGQPRESQYSTTFDAEYKEESYNTNGTTKVAKFQPNGDISGQSPVESAFNQRHQVWPISTTSPFGDSNRNLTYRPAYETTRNPQPIPQRNFPLTMTEATPINYTIYQTPDKLMNQRSPEMRKPSETDFSGSPQSTPPKILSPRVFLPVSQVYSAVIPLVGIGLVASVLAILNLQLIFAITTDQISLDEVDERREILSDICLTFCSVSLSFSIASVFVGFLQFYFSLKILKLAPNSAIRVILYLNQSYPLRFLVFAGFFLGTLLFVIAVVLYISMFSSTVSTVVFTVMAGVGVLLCIITALHTVYSWLWGSLQLSDKEKDGTTRASQDAILSTLV